jgi:hypothetical protein
VKRAEAKAKLSALRLRNRESKEVEEEAKVCFFFLQFFGCALRLDGEGAERG